MKRTANLFDEVVEWKNLRLAAYKAFRGKRTRLDARQFARQLDWRLNQMADQLRDGSFSLGRYDQFVIHDYYRGRKSSFSVEVQPFPGSAIRGRATAVS